MATSSIFQTVYIKDRKKIARFVKALEQSKATKAKEVTFSRPVEQVSDPETIRKMFGDTEHDRVQDHHN